MVALNWQNQDKGMMLNEAMFAGEQGWVLKPTGYRSTDGDSEIVRHNVDLSLEIFAGQGLPLPPGDSSEKAFRPYVSCQLHVEQPEDRVDAKENRDTDSKNTKYKRRTRTCSGINPDFGGETITFSTAPGVVEKLSFLRSVHWLFFYFPRDSVIIPSLRDHRALHCRPEQSCAWRCLYSNHVGALLPHGSSVCPSRHCWF